MINVFWVYNGDGSAIIEVPDWCVFCASVKQRHFEVEQKPPWSISFQKCTNFEQCPAFFSPLNPNNLIQADFYADCSFILVFLLLFSAACKFANES